MSTNQRPSKPIKLYSLKEAVEYLPIDLQSLYNHVRLGHVPVVRFGVRVFIDDATLTQITREGLQWDRKHNKRGEPLGQLKTKLKKPE